MSLCILAVCAAHESVVEDFGMRHAVSEGMWVSIDRQGDVERASGVSGRTANVRRWPRSSVVVSALSVELSWWVVMLSSLLDASGFVKGI